MEPIAIVKKRSRIWLVMALLIVLMLLVAAALWFMGDTPPTDISGGWHQPDVLLQWLPALAGSNG